VVGEDACRAAAEVVEFHPIGDGSEEEFIGEAVDWATSLVAVTLAKLPGPDPTLALRGNAPE
jgi:hypothetical protein